MGEASQFNEMGLNQDLASQFCQSQGSKCYIDQSLELHDGERVLQKEITYIDTLHGIHLQDVESHYQTLENTLHV